MKIFALITFCLIAVSSLGQNKDVVSNGKQDEIIEEYLKNGAWNYHYLTKEWDEWINKGIQEDSTIALLWQQKALPFWKQKKYQLAIMYYNKAVALDRQRWLSRLAFLKCIFAKDYEGALTDLIAYKKEFGSTYEQDHTLEFYMGICYLQLNQFDEALKTLKEDIETQERKHGTNWVHFLDRYYLAIAYYEQSKYEGAIVEFDKVLDQYPNFSDAQYYKSLCLNYLGEKEKAKVLMAKGKVNFHNGNTFYEDSNIYETYPYQLSWQWKSAESIVLNQKRN
ncbi:MAG: tetratricopeptide repeat protein [Chitinophagales bacterium]|nr:tetratricopeptide repeat protein [Chitinophagales bacterium]